MQMTDLDLGGPEEVNNTLFLWLNYQRIVTSFLQMESELAICKLYITRQTTMKE